MISDALRTPLVDYLILDGVPHLAANECTSCGARFFDRRNACAACFDTEFKRVDITTEGFVTAFTIVHASAPGVVVPFVAATVDCGGTTVAGNIVGSPPDPDHIFTGMRVQLTTYSLGVDGEGTEAIGYAFTPVH